MKKQIIALFATSVTVSTLLTGCVTQPKEPKEPIDLKGPIDIIENTDDTPDDSTENTTEPTNSDDIQGKQSDDVDIIPTENATITFVDYVTPEEYMTCKIPTGWQVETIPGDILGYQLKIYDPSCPARMVYFCPTVTAYKSQAAVDLAKQYDYTGADWSLCPINTECTTSSFFANSGQFFSYTDYSEIANLGENGWGGDVLQSSCTYAGTECEGIFTCGTTLPLGTLYYFDVDIAPTTEYGTIIMMAPADEFPSWEPVLTEISSSIIMTDAYQQARVEAWGGILNTSEQIAAVANYTSDLIMSGWESRNNTYDILSQQRSDATLGRDRVYDTETGEVYYTDLGWYDNYDGTRFEYVDEGSSYYNLPVYGTIE